MRHDFMFLVYYIKTMTGTTDIFEILEGGGYDANYFRNEYPGFPNFVHEIMAHISQGRSAEEAARLSASDLKDRLTSVINEVEQTHAFYNEEGGVTLPQYVIDYLETNPPSRVTHTDTPQNADDTSNDLGTIEDEVQSEGSEFCDGI